MIDGDVNFEADLALLVKLKTDLILVYSRVHSTMDPVCLPPEIYMVKAEDGGSIPPVPILF